MEVRDKLVIRNVRGMSDMMLEVSELEIRDRMVNSNGI